MNGKNSDQILICTVVAALVIIIGHTSLAELFKIKL